MVGGHEGNAVVVVELAPETRNTGIRIQKGPGGKTAQSTDRQWANDLKLLCQEGLAHGDLVSLWIAVAGWTALDHVTYVNLVSFQPHGIDDPGKKLTRLTDERLSLDILVSPWRFTNEHDLRSGISHTEYDPGSVCGKTTPGAISKFLPQRFKVSFSLWRCSVVDNRDVVRRYVV